MGFAALVGMGSETPVWEPLPTNKSNFSVFHNLTSVSGKKKAPDGDPCLKFLLGSCILLCPALTLHHFQLSPAVPCSCLVNCVKQNKNKYSTKVRTACAADLPRALFKNRGREPAALETCPG